MVLTFFRSDDEGGLKQVSNQLTNMLVDARHSFDLAMAAILGGTDSASVVAEVHATDTSINETEQEIRRRLLVHAAVRGSADIEVVLAYLLLSRKIERIGDQAKNILDLAEEGVSLAGEPDLDQLIVYRDQVSGLYADIHAVLVSPDAEAGAALQERGHELVRSFEAELRALMHTDAPSSFGVPRALLYRYLKRIAANLVGISSGLFDPFDQVDYPGGADTDD